MKSAFPVLQCKNCGVRVEGNFCSHCGQKSTTDRIHFRYLSQQFAREVLQWERGLLYTVFALFTQPGAVIKGYISGQRQTYTRPFTYLVITTAVYIYLSVMFGIETVLQDFIAGVHNSIEDNGPGASSGVLSILQWLDKNYVVAVLVSVPMLSLATWMAFYRSGYNYLEHFIINLYVSCQRMIIYVILSPLTLLWEGFEPLSFLVALLYTFFFYFQVFDVFSSTRRVISIVSAFVLFLVFFLLITTLIVIINSVMGS